MNTQPKNIILLSNMKKSVSTIIYEYLKEHEGEYFPGYDFCNKEVYVKGKRYWIGNGGDRKARLLVEMGAIERKRDGRYSYFRVKPAPKPIPIIAQKSLAFSRDTAYNKVNKE